MGLDGVEIVMAVEERFGIVITDAEATVCTTPGHLVDLVKRKLPHAGARVCTSQRAFHLLRRALTNASTLPRDEIRLESALPVPKERSARMAFWSALRAGVGARSWPELVRPRWLVVVLWLVSLAGFAGTRWITGWLASAFPDWVTSWTDAWTAVGWFSFQTFCTCLLAVFLALITRRFRTEIPRKVRTVRDLVPFAMTSDSITWHRDEVSEEVRKIVMEQLGLKDGQYTEDADFIRDLGLD